MAFIAVFIDLHMESMFPRLFCSSKILSWEIFPKITPMQSILRAPHLVVHIRRFARFGTIYKT